MCTRQEGMSLRLIADTINETYRGSDCHASLFSVLEHIDGLQLRSESVQRIDSLEREIRQLQEELDELRKFEEFLSDEELIQYNESEQGIEAARINALIIEKKRTIEEINTKSIEDSKAKMTHEFDWMGEPLTTQRW